MRKKSIIGGILAASIALTATLGGCSLISTNNKADMAQTVAEVNISKAVGGEFDESYQGAVGTTKVIKRELVSYFINVGSSYINNGNSYEEAFNSIVDTLVENAVLTQYATMYLLRDKGEDVLNKFKSIADEKGRYEYLLGGEDSADVKIAKYSIMYAMNAAIDIEERKILKNSSSASGSETRETPSKVNAEKEDFYPTETNESDGLYYNFYTGYEGYLLKDSGAYGDDALKGTKKATRIKAYNEYMKTYSENGIVDAKTEDLSDIWNVRYVQEQYVNQLKQRVINKYYELYEDEQEDLLNGKDGEKYNYGYIKESYENKLISQQLDYTSYKSDGAFASALDNMSDSSFVLYAPDTTDIKTADKGTFGFVYNILLPFDSMQSVSLTGLKTKYADEKADGGYKPNYFTERNSLLKNIKTTDRRAAWFNGETDYAFDAKAAGIDYFGDSGWLFFENNLTKPDRYESLDKYLGKYAYNGTVIEKDDEYVLTPNKLSVDDMLEEFKKYVDYAMGTPSVNYTPVSNYYKTYDKDNLYKKVDGEDVVDYENFVYATGKVDLGGWTRNDALVKTSGAYKALSAVNELQYAYTTDTGVLSQYIGYTVNAVDTDYIKEFQFAAQQAVNKGAGNFTVCAGDYGWHLIYVTYTFGVDGGEQYNPDFTKERIDTEGTFENIFYEWLKSATIANVANTRKAHILTEYNTDGTVTKYQKAYQDLIDIGK